MASPKHLRSRLRGALLAHATIDALGGPLEFKARHSFPLLTTMQPNDNFDLGPGCFTDDTSMALCLAHSLLEGKAKGNARRGKADDDDDDDDDEGYAAAAAATDQARRYIRWWRQGWCSSVGWCFDVGVGTRGALGCWERILERRQGDDEDDNGDNGEDKEEAEQENENEKGTRGLREIAKGWGGENACGNGSLMRVLPVALVVADAAEAEQVAKDSGRVTHPNQRCGLCCTLFVRLVGMALAGRSKAQMAAAVPAYLGELSNASDDRSVDRPFVERFERYAAGLSAWEKQTEDAISSSGYVIDSLEAALWSFFTTSSLRAGAIKAVNLGDDADTVGAIYGGLAGAFYGEDAIPQDWLAALKNLDMVMEVADEIVRVRTGREG